MKIQCRRVPVVTDKRIVPESQAICYSVLLLLYLACIHVILHLQRGNAMLHTFSINVHDGRARVVKIQVGKGITTRAVTRLCHLELEN